MIDYGLKAPTEALIKSKLAAAGLALVVDDLFLLEPGVAYDFIGQIERVPAVMSEDGETVITPAEMTSDVHANIRFYGDDAAVLETKLKAVTLIAYKADGEGAPAIEGTADGFKIYPLSKLSSPSRVWA